MGLRPCPEIESTGPEFCRPADEELPDSFFDFTPEDFAHVTSAAARTATRAEVGLKTRKLRDAEQHARAARFGPVCWDLPRFQG